MGDRGHMRAIRLLPFAAAVSSTERTLLDAALGRLLYTYRTDGAKPRIWCPASVSLQPKRRPDPQMTAIIVGVVTTQLVTLLSWLSQYPGGPIRVWQIPALLAETIC